MRHKKNKKSGYQNKNKGNINKFNLNNLSESFKIRQRKNIQVLNVDETVYNVPFCLHDENNKKWFSCSVYRCSKECKFKVNISDDNILDEYKKFKIISFPIEEYGKIFKTFNILKKQKQLKIYWCSKCMNYVSSPHKDPVEGPFEEFIPPTKILHAIENTKGEAQYWFSNDTLNVIQQCLIKENIDSILCIGSPTVFEFFSDLNRFLLDIDDRFSLYYTNDLFARYSMLTNFFFYLESKEKLKNFFISSKKLAIVCDPPFGAFVSVLMKSLINLQDIFLETHLNKDYDFSCKFILFLPVFVTKHVLKLYPDFSIIDYKVTYKNHRDFSSSEKSIVRIITNFTNSSFKLPTKLGYKFCDICKRFVAESNSHCSFCKLCTSKDGTVFLHCKICKKCVKSSYTHCQKCNNCHLQKRCNK